MPAPDLTPREQQVLDLTRQGYTMQEIATRLGHSRRTTQYFSDRLRAKYGVKHRRQLLRTEH